MSAFYLMRPVFQNFSARQMRPRTPAMIASWTMLDWAPTFAALTTMMTARATIARIRSLSGLFMARMIAQVAS